MDVVKNGRQLSTWTGIVLRHVTREFEDYVASGRFENGFLGIVKLRKSGQIDIGFSPDLF